MKFNNGKARGICYSNQWLDVPSDYLLAEEFWGAFYYKSYGEMTIKSAEARCKADGAFLPTPKSLLENAFYADLYPNGQVWLRYKLQRDGTTLVTISGGDPATFTNWGTDLIYAEDIFSKWSNAYIDTRNLSQDIFADLNRWNNNKSKSDVANVVCMRRIPSKCARVLLYPRTSHVTKRFQKPDVENSILANILMVGQPNSGQNYGIILMMRGKPVGQSETLVGHWLIGVTQSDMKSNLVRGSTQKALNQIKLPRAHGSKILREQHQHIVS